MDNQRLVRKDMEEHESLFNITQQRLYCCSAFQSVTVGIVYVSENIWRLKR
jgi:hypothetical protein